MCLGPLFFGSFSWSLSALFNNSPFCVFSLERWSKSSRADCEAALKFSPPADGYAHSAGGYLETLMEHQPPLDLFGLNSSDGSAHFPPPEAQCYKHECVTFSTLPTYFPAICGSSSRPVIAAAALLLMAAAAWRRLPGCLAASATCFCGPVWDVCSLSSHWII